MFRFLFGKGNVTGPAVVQETQRQTITRASREINEILATLSPKARITIYPEEGTLSIDLPEQMPDEAKALPAPSRPDASKPGPQAENAQAETTQPGAKPD